MSAVKQLKMSGRRRTKSALGLLLALLGVCVCVCVNYEVRAVAVSENCRYDMGMTKSVSSLHDLLKVGGARGRSQEADPRASCHFLRVSESR